MPKFCGSMVPRFTNLRCLNVTLPEYLLIVFCVGCGVGCGVGVVAEAGVVDDVRPRVVAELVSASSVISEQASHQTYEL